MDFRHLRSTLTTVLCVYFGNAQECEYDLVDLPDNLLIDTNIDIGQSVYNITAVDVYFRNMTGVVTLMNPSENFDIKNNRIVVTNCPYLEQEIDLYLLPDNNENCQTTLHITVTAPVADIIICSQREVFVDTLVHVTTIDVLEFELVNVRDCGQFVCSVRSDNFTNDISLHNGGSNQYVIKTGTANISFGKVYTLKLACVDINVEDIPPEAFVTVSVTFTNSTASRCISNTTDALVSSTQFMLQTTNVVGLILSLSMSKAASMSNVSITIGTSTTSAMAANPDRMTMVGLISSLSMITAASVSYISITIGKSTTSVTAANPDKDEVLFFDEPGNIAAISAAAGAVVLGSVAAGVYAVTSKRCSMMLLDESATNGIGENDEEDEN